MKNAIYTLLLLTACTLTAQKIVPTIYGEKITLQQALPAYGTINWNNMTTPGLYGVNNVSTNCPVSAANTNPYLQVTTNDATIANPHLNQMAFNRYGGANEIWMRSKPGTGAWTAWSRFITDDNPGNSVWKT